MYRTTTIVLLLILCGCSGDAGRQSALPRVNKTSAEEAADDSFTTQVQARNVTDEFRERFHSLDQFLSKENLGALKEYDILLVHGLLGDVGIKAVEVLDKFNREQRLIDYLKDQEKAFGELGLESRVAKFKSESVDASGTKIARVIRDNPRPVVVISHSKGCLDTLDALIKLKSEGKLSKVAGWVAIQGPFFGAPNADVFSRHWYTRLGGTIAMNCLGDKFDSVRDLTSRRRREYMEQHNDTIAQITKTLPVICFASWLGHPKAGHGKLNDGEIPPQNCILPGVDYVAKANISHAMTVIHSDKPFDRVTFTKALMVMLAERIEKRTTAVTDGTQ